MNAQSPTKGASSRGSPTKKLYAAVVTFVEKIAGDAMDESERDRFDKLCTKLSKSIEKAGKQDLENGERKQAENHCIQLVKLARGMAERNIEAIEWAETREFCGLAMALAEQTRFDSLLKFINAFGQFIDFKKTSDSLAALAEKASRPRKKMEWPRKKKVESERDKKRAGRRYRFDQDLNEVALLFRQTQAPSLSPADKHRAYEKIALHLQQASAEESKLIRAGDFPVSMFKEQEDFHRLGDQSKRRANLIDIKVGRKESPYFLEIIFLLGSAWARGARRPPAVTTVDNKRGGPFVKFVLAAAQGFDPDGGWEKRSAIGDTIKTALSTIKKRFGDDVFMGRN